MRPKDKAQVKDFCLNIRIRSYLQKKTVFLFVFFYRSRRKLGRMVQHELLPGWDCARASEM